MRVPRAKSWLPKPNGRRIFGVARHRAEWRTVDIDDAVAVWRALYVPEVERERENVIVLGPGPFRPKFVIAVVEAAKSLLSILKQAVDAIVQSVDTGRTRCIDRTEPGAGGSSWDLTHSRGPATARKWTILIVPPGGSAAE